MNASPGSLAVERPLTGFSESQEQKVDEQISSDSGPSSVIPPTAIAIWSPHRRKKAVANKIMALFKEKDLDIDSYPSVVKRLTDMKEFFQSDFNSMRRQSKISDVTCAKTLERSVIILDPRTYIAICNL